MVNILLEGYGIDADWLYGVLKKYIKPEMTVAVVAFSFRDSRVKSVADWNLLYGRYNGIFYRGMMDRIRELELYDVLMEHDGTVMGYSAGALIQLSEYHLSPDEDYPVFCYYNGLPYLSGFYLEVHYENTDVQNDAIRRVIAERGKPVYATALGAGALIVDGGDIRTLGDVKIFDK